MMWVYGPMPRQPSVPMKISNNLFFGLIDNLTSKRVFKISNLEKLLGKQIKILSRKEVEEYTQENILVHAKKYPCVFLTPGDPNIATTHIDLRLRAENEGIRTSIIHSASISSAIAGATGLQNYKFGRTVTI